MYFHEKPGYHSIGQLWAANESGGNSSTVEEGWIEAPLSPYQDVSPHLFMAMSDCGYYPNGGYVGISGIPWVQTSSSVYPNMVLTHDDRVHEYAVWRDASLNWHFYYDGQWVGYIPHAAWTCRFPKNVNSIQFGGEVATPELEEYTCSDMGNGTFGPNAADHEYTYWVNEKYAQPGNFIENHVLQSDSVYKQGYWQGGNGFVWGFRYGGGGWC